MCSTECVEDRMKWRDTAAAAHQQTAAEPELVEENNTRTDRQASLDQNFVCIFLNVRI